MSKPLTHQPLLLQQLVMDAHWVCTEAVTGGKDWELWGVLTLW